MDRSTVSRSGLAGLFTTLAALLVFSAAAMAQVEQHSQINIQGTALFTKNSNSDSRALSQRTTESGGLLVGYSFQFNSWAGVEGNYGYTQNTVYTTTQAGESSVRSDLHEITGSFVAHIPAIVHLRPYGLFGAGALVFNPTDYARGMHPDIRRQTKPAFLYGAGVNYNIARNFGVRAEYRGLIYKATDFDAFELSTDKVTHLAQPSVGFFFRF